MTNLKLDHPYLYKRVKLKVIVHLLFGIILLFFPSQAPNLSYTPILHMFGLITIGVIYILIGTMIAIGLYSEKRTYQIARLGLYLASVFNFLIFISLFAVFFKSRSAAFFMVIYGYFTYNVWYVTRDPGWSSIKLIKNMETTDGRKNLGITE